MAKSTTHYPSLLSLITKRANLANARALKSAERAVERERNRELAQLDRELANIAQDSLPEAKDLQSALEELKKARDEAYAAEMDVTRAYYNEQLYENIKKSIEKDEKLLAYFDSQDTPEQRAVRQEVSQRSVNELNARLQRVEKWEDSRNIATEMYANIKKDLAEKARAKESQMAQVTDELKLVTEKIEKMHVRMHRDRAALLKAGKREDVDTLLARCQLMMLPEINKCKELVRQRDEIARCTVTVPVAAEKMMSAERNTRSKEKRAIKS